MGETNVLVMPTQYASVGAGLAQSFHCLPQATAMADGNDEVTFSQKANFVYDFRRRGGAGDRQSENDEQVFQKFHQVCGEVAAKQDHVPGCIEPTHQSSDLLWFDVWTRRFRFLTS